MIKALPLVERVEKLENQIEIVKDDVSELKSEVIEHTESINIIHEACGEAIMANREVLRLGDLEASSKQKLAAQFKLVAKIFEKSAGDILKG